MPDLNPHQLRRACDRVAPGYDAADFLCAEVRQRLLDRLDLVSIEPLHILDLGCGTGAATQMLNQRYPQAQVTGLDWSEKMLAIARAGGTSVVCADSHELPCPDASFDLVVSNLMLPACSDYERIFCEVRRVLRTPGLFLFSTLGPDSLKEIRRAWAKVDRYPHVHDHDDMHLLGDAVVRAGFREPVMDVEMLTIRYGETDAMIRDLRAMAATNFSQRRRRGLTTPGNWNRAITALESGRDTDGKLPFTAEVITGQAWTGDPGIGVPLEDGEARFPLSQLRRSRLT